MPQETHRITQNLASGILPDQQLPSGHILVDRYLIQEVIGIGGMGSVYRARDMHFPNVVKLVAVKEMINQARDPLVRETIVENFEREANILVTLSHPSIPRIFDYFTYDDRSYLVIEYVNGRDLEVVLNETPGLLSPEQVLGWAIELCDVLSYLHGHKPEPIIFRDMKPSNVMVDQSGHIVLVDFGIAKVFRIGQKGTMIGTEGYSPPEQYRGEASQQADIYALGATLHHLLSKRDPRLETPFTFNERPIRKAHSGVAPELEAVIERALQYNPDDRFPTALEMKEALLAVARKTGVLNRMSFPSAAHSARPDTVKPLWMFECEDEIRGSITLENGQLYLGSYDNNLYALNAGTGAFVWKYATEGGIVGKPAFYDSTLFVGSADKRLHAVSSRTGKMAWTYYADGPIRSSPRIAEGHIFFGSDDNHLHAVNLLSSRSAWRVETSGPVRSSPFITNEYVYFGDEAGEVYCVDFTGQIKWRYRAKRAVTSSPLVSQGMLIFSSTDSYLYVVDAKSGWMLWKFRMGKGSVSTPAQCENLIFVGSADEFIYAIDANSSKEVWRFHTEHQVSGSPLVYKDSVYCGSADGNLYCLEFRSGRLRWKFSTGGPLTGCPIVYNDVLYFGSSDHFVYALMA